MLTPTINLQSIGFYDGHYRYEVISLKNTLSHRPGEVLLEDEVTKLINSKRYSINIRGKTRRPNKNAPEEHILGF